MGPRAHSRRLQNLSLGQRIAAVGCLFLLTVVGALYFFVTKGFSKDVAFATLEQFGNEYQRPLEQLLESVSESQLLARRYLAGHKELDGQLRVARQRVDEALESLRAVDSRLGPALQFTTEGMAKRKREHSRYESVAREWRDLRDGKSGAAVEDSDKAHTHLITDIRTLITHAGDTSNLILDPDLDSYYLMDVTLLALPQTQDRLGAIERLGQETLGGQQIGEHERQQFAVAAAMLKEADLDRIVADAQTSLSEDQNFYGVSQSLQQKLPPAVQAYVTTTEALIAGMRKVAGSPDSAVNQAEFLERAKAAREASFRLWHVAVAELDVLLVNRMDHLAGARRRAVILTALALLVSVGIVVFVIRRTTKFLQTVVQQLLDQAGAISNTSKLVSGMAEGIASRTIEQAASLEQASSSSKTINATTRKNAQSARAVAQKVIEASRTANYNLTEMATSMSDIDESSGKISKIVKVIDEIAFQTNILALNAAVEAARAGEAGLGFGVVAYEVRILSQRCAQAAQNTADLIEESRANASQGKAKLNKVTVVVGSLIASATEVQTLADEVSAGSDEQARGLAQVTDAIARMDLATKTGAKNAERTAAASQDLGKQSDGLHAVAVRLSGLVSGGSGLGQNEREHAGTPRRRALR